VHLSFDTSLKNESDKLLEQGARVSLLYSENNEVVLGDSTNVFLWRGSANGRKWCIWSRATNSPKK
jgi:hypothetical protein